MPPPPTLQFNPSPLSVPRHSPTFPTPSAHSLLHLSALIETDSLTLASLSEPPLSLLPHSTLLSFRDLHYSTTALPSSTPSHLAATTRLLNLHPSAPHPQLVPLSLIAPHAVVIAICDWASRQIVPERRRVACHALAALGSLTSYPVRKGATSSLLVQWLVQAFEQCDEGDVAHAKRLCAFVCSLMCTRGALGTRLLTGGDWAIGIFSALLDRGCLGHAFAVGMVVGAVKGDLICESDHLETVVGELVQLCAWEKRCRGEMAVVEGAIECLSVLRHKFGPEAMMCVPRASALVLWSCGEEGAARVVEMLRRSNKSLETCEMVLVLYATWWGGMGHVDKLLKEARIEEEWERGVWITALVRQMSLLTESEIGRLFTGGAMVELVPGEGSRTVRFANLGARAVMVLLRCQEITEQVCVDEMVVVRGVRALCKAFLKADERRGKDLIRLLKELLSLITECYDEEVLYVEKFPVLVEVLTETSVELVRKIRKCLEDRAREGHETITNEVNRLIDMMQLLKDGNSVSRTVCTSSIAILSGSDP